MTTIASRPLFAALLALALICAVACPCAALEPLREAPAIVWEDLVAPAAHDEPQTALTNDAALNALVEQRRSAPVNPALNGQTVRLSGFVVPLERDADGALTEFLLVPYFGACIHVPPPPENQTVLVRSETPLTGVETMDAVTVSGTLRLESSETALASAAYAMAAFSVAAAEKGGAGSYVAAAGLTLACGASILAGAALARFGGAGRDRFLGVGVGFAAGVMTALGASIVAADHSLPGVSAFLGGAAVMLLFDAMARYAARRSVNRPERAPDPGRHRVALALAVHNLPELFAVFSASLMNPAFGVALGVAALAHSVPLGFVFATPRRVYWGQALLAGAFPAAAAILLHALLKPLLSSESFPALYAFVGGIMVYLALRELLPAAFRRSGAALTAGGFGAGALFLTGVGLALPGFVLPGVT